MHNASLLDEINFSLRADTETKRFLLDQTDIISVKNWKLTKACECA